MPYWQLFYHFVTATKERRPLIKAEYEQEIYQYILFKARELETRVFAINGIADHVHLVASVPPKLAVATFIGQVKGYSSARFNKHHPELPAFAWQDDYSVFSFDNKRLDPCLDYVNHQKDHHRVGQLIAALEYCEEQRSRIAEQPEGYLTGPFDTLTGGFLNEFPW